MARLPLTLQTRVGRRMVALFVLCALVPVLAVAALGYAQVRGQLLTQTRAQLAQSAKSVGMGILDQLRDARTTLDDARTAIRAGILPPFAKAADAARAREIFSSLTRMRGETADIAWGSAPVHPVITPRIEAALDSGGTTLAIAPASDTNAVWLVAATFAGDRLWASIKHEYLFTGARERAVIGAGDTDVCIRESAGRILECSDLEPPRGDDIAESWQVFLGYDYDAPSWEVVVSQRAAVTLAPILTFRRTFLATLIAMLGLVVAISAAQVRRSLRPLHELGEGTARLARRDFTRPVQVTSRDEFGDLAASFNTMTSELEQQFASNTQLIGRLEQLSYGALAALARAVDASSHWTAGHSERVTSLSVRMAERMGLAGGRLETLHRGGLLHDIGKIGISPDIIDKPGLLNAEELARIRQHPELGARILAPLEAFADAVPIVLYHHERFDGAGYPHGLAGEKIPELARLLAVADVYDALVSSRPYRAGWERELALDTIRESSGTHFDPMMVELFFLVMSAEGDGARFALAYLEPA